MRIGITGSYGKTSVKHILGAILSEKYPTLITPASFNTPMGVTRAIREKLTPSHQVFVGEMGARHVGDIKEMCRLVHPTIGIITSVGPQHLETFKTIGRVASTKYGLIEALPAERAEAGGGTTPVLIVAPDGAAALGAGAAPEALDRAFLDELTALNDLFHREYGVPLTLSELGVSRDDLPAVAKQARYDGAAPYHETEITLEDAMAVLEAAY